MKRQLLLIVVTMALAGCGSSGLPYKPDHPSGVPISADFSLLLDRLRIEIETGGYRLEDAHILKTDGTGVSPQTIEHPAPRGGSGIGIGIGVGGGSTGGRGGVGVGTGIGVGTTIGEGRAEGNTVAFFSLDQVGPAPWRLRVKLVGIEPAVIVLVEPVARPDQPVAGSEREIFGAFRPARWLLSASPSPGRQGSRPRSDRRS